MPSCFLFVQRRVFVKVSSPGAIKYCISRRLAKENSGLASLTQGDGRSQVNHLNIYESGYIYEVHILAAMSVASGGDGRYIK